MQSPEPPVLRGLGYIETVAVGRVLEQGDTLEAIVLKC